MSKMVTLELENQVLLQRLSNYERKGKRTGSTERKKRKPHSKSSYKNEPRSCVESRQTLLVTPSVTFFDETEENEEPNL